MNRTSFCLLATSIGLAVSSGAALAQQAGAASAPMGSASMPHDCKPMHDHGAEKGMPMAKSMNCPMGGETAASAPAKKAKAKPRHNHAKFHKNQG